MKSNIRTTMIGGHNLSTDAPTIKYSKHYSEDRAHRGIGKNDVQMALAYGDHIYCHDAKVYYFSRRSIEKMKRDGVSRKVIDAYEKKKNVRIVMSMDNVVITTMYANRVRERVKWN